MGSSTQSWATGLPESYSSRWFITSWPGGYVGASDAALLFVLDSSASCCLCLRLFRSAPPNWEYGELARWLNAYCTPDALVTDEHRLQHTLVTAGARLDRATSAHLDKSITLLTPAVASCMRSLECLFNDSEFQMFTTLVDINAAPMGTLPDLLSSRHHRRGASGESSAPTVDGR